MSGRRRDSGTLPGSRRLTFESRTFPKFWPDTESFESRGERSRKDSVYRDYTNFAGAGEPGRFICLAQCPRTSGGRSQRSGECEISMPLHRCQDCHCCRSELLPSAPSSPVLSLRFPMKKKKCIVDRGIVETLTYPFIVVFLSFFCFVENVETPNNNRSGSKAAFHDSTNPQQQSVNASSPSPL